MSLRPDVLNQKEYWYKLVFFMIEFLLVTILLFVVADLQNAELPGTPVFHQAVAITALGFMVVNAIVVGIAMLILILRRARDIGDTLLWFLIGFFVPFGMIIIGLIPSKRSK